METKQEHTTNISGIDEERKAGLQNVNSKNANEMAINCEVNCSELPVEKVKYRGNDDIEHKSKDFEEKPMDLTFTQRLTTPEKQSGSSFKSLKVRNINNMIDSKVYDEARINASFTIANIIQADHLYSNASVPKKRGRKRKADIEVPSAGTSLQYSTYNNLEVVRTVDTRQSEVLMAAKSLFSKRTRTLYHWMYPDIPNAQLKSAVTLSWENLGHQEKQFYISQVLGRFGFPQSNLMINPQLSGLLEPPVLAPVNLSTPLDPNSETHRAISNILEEQENVPNEDRTSWRQYDNMFSESHTNRISRKRGKVGRPPGSKSQKRLKEHTVFIRPVTVENTVEDFEDDPELREEYEQFKWALHMNQ